MSWTPRLAPGEKPPVMLEQWYDLACSDLYLDSGICRHLPYIRSVIKSTDRVVELGVGGSDQGSLALLSACPKRMDSYDVVVPAALPTIKALAQSHHIDYRFHHEDTTKATPLEHDVLFVDSWHSSEIVDAEIERWTPLTRRLIIAHDVVTFGRNGQGGAPNTGITLSFGDFLFRHPEWRVVNFREIDNGLLTLEHQGENQ